MAEDHEPRKPALDLRDSYSIRRLPPRALRPFIASYEGYREALPGGVRRLEVPVPAAVLILNFGDDLLVESPATRTAGPERFGSFVAGLHDGYAVVEAPGLSHGMQVNLTPVGARMLTGLPMQTLTNRTVALGDALGRQAVVAEQLEAARDWDARFALLDGFLIQQLAAADLPSEGVAWAWHQLRRSDGAISVGALREALGWSHQVLVARFREEVGLAPKAAARVLRFDRVVRTVRESPPVSWADLAFASGYYDQAHFNREFRAFTGRTPGEFLASQLPGGRGVLAG